VIEIQQNNKNKKIGMLTMTLLVIAILITTLFSGCTQQTNQGLHIVLVGRSPPSGTRDYFVSAVMNNVNMSPNLYEKLSNGDVYATVNTTEGAIGYVGIGFITSWIKVLTINNITANVANVFSKTYPLSRDLYLVTKGDATGKALEFIRYLQSKEGQAFVTEEGFVPDPDYQAVTYNSTGKSLTGTLTISGSTTVDPIVEKAKDAFMQIYPGLTITVTAPGSGAGITAVNQGNADLAMSSRDLTAAETSSGLVKYTVAKDGLAIIVNHANTYVNNLSLVQLKAIYKGDITNWTNVSKI
jgi:phosphate transport system substrate-binding protein